MATRENTTSEHQQALNASQVLFTANPAFLAPQAKHALQTQERFFDEAEKFAAAWFERRREATQSLIDAARRIASAGQGDPSNALTEIIEWRTKSMERLAEDMKDYTTMLGRCAGTVVKEEAVVVEELSETMTRATTTSKSKPL